MKPDAWTDPPDAQEQARQQREAVLNELLTRTRFDYTKELPDPEPVLLLGEIPIGTPGNLIILSGGPKTGKTAVLEAIVAAQLAPNGTEPDTFGFHIRNPDNQAVVHIDSEQPPAQFYKLMRRTMRRANVNVAPDWLHAYHLLGNDAATTRAALSYAIGQAAEQHRGVRLVIVDGVGDLVVDLNDQKEAMPLVAELHALAIKFNCLIVLVIHTNPTNADKTRGHLGSHLERKSETNLRLEKDKDQLTVIYSTVNRGAPIPRNKGHAFSWDNQSGMHRTVENTRQSAGRGPKATVEQVVGLLRKNGLEVADWKAKAKAELGIEKTAFYALKAEAVRLKLVAQDITTDRWLRS